MFGSASKEPRSISPLKRAHSQAISSQFALPKSRDAEEDDSSQLDPYSHGESVVVEHHNSESTEETDVHVTLVQQFGGESREQLNELQYLLDGLDPKQSDTVKLSSATQLIKELENSSVLRLVRSSGALRQVFLALQKFLDNPTLRQSMVSIASLVTKDKDSAKYMTEPCIQVVLDLVCGKERSYAPASPSAGAATQKPQAIRRKSLKRKPSGSLTSEAESTPLAVRIQDEALVYQDEVAFDILQHASEDPTFSQHLAKLDAASMLIPRFEECLSAMLANDDAATPTKKSKSAQASEHKRLLQLMCVFENMTNSNAGNQLTVLEYRHSNQGMMDMLLRLLLRCQRKLAIASASAAADRDQYRSYALAGCRFLVNITNHSDSGCEAVNAAGKAKGAHADADEGRNIIEAVLKILGTASESAHADNFDLSTTALGVLINLIEHSETSRQHFMTAEIGVGPNGSTVGALDFIVQLFKKAHTFYLEYLKKERLNSKPSPNSLSSPNSHSSSSIFESPPSKSKLFATPKRPFTSPTKSLTGEEQEKEVQVVEQQMLGSYTALLIGCLLKYNSPRERPAIISKLPGQSCAAVSGKLKEFLVLQSDVSLLTDRALESIVDIIESLDSH